MSMWHEVTDPDHVEIEPEYQGSPAVLSILYDTNAHGNNYVTVPVDVVRKLLETPCPQCGWPDREREI